MIKKHVFFLLFLLPFSCLLLSCDDSTEPQLSEPQVFTLKNGSVESGNTYPSYWFSNSNGLNIYSQKWTNSTAATGSYSLEIMLDSVIDNQSFAYWGQTITTSIPVDRKLTLEAIIKLENITGNGVAIAIAGYYEPLSTSADIFASTGGTVEIKGTKDWASYTVTSPDIPHGISKINVYLILVKSTIGTVYFDDISLTVE